MKKSFRNFILMVALFVLVSMVNIEPAWAALPAPPTNLEAVGGHYSSITLSWTDNSDNESQFRIWRKKQGDAFFSHSVTVPANTRKYKDEGLEPGTTYCYRMASSNGDGNSAYSNQVSATTSERPTIRILSPNGGEVWQVGETHYITWTTDAELQTGILYYIDDFAGSPAHEIVIGLAPDIHTYLWTVPSVMTNQARIRVYGHPVDSGETFSDETDAYFTIAPSDTTEVVPMGLPAPSNLVLENEGTEVRLDWQDNSSSELGFRIYYRINDGEAGILDSVGPNTTTYNAHLAPGNNYAFRVQAFNAMVSSGYSNVVNVTIAEDSVVEVEPEDDSDSSPGTGQTVLRFYIDSVEYYVQTPSDSNSRLLTMDTAPIISGGRTLLPICYVSEPLGADVLWDAYLDQVTVKLGSKTIVMWINNGSARINGVETAIDPVNPAVTPIIIPPGRTMLPLSFIAANLGCDVQWNAATREVIVTYPKL